MIPKLFQSKIFYFLLEKFCSCACTVLRPYGGGGYGLLLIGHGVIFSHVSQLSTFV